MSPEALLWTLQLVNCAKFTCKGPCSTFEKPKSVAYGLPTRYALARPIFASASHTASPLFLTSNICTSASPYQQPISGLSASTMQ